MCVVYVWLIHAEGVVVSPQGGTAGRMPNGQSLGRCQKRRSSGPGGGGKAVSGLGGMAWSGIVFRGRQGHSKRGSSEVERGGAGVSRVPWGGSRVREKQTREEGVREERVWERVREALGVSARGASASVYLGKKTGKEARGQH